MRMKGRSSNIEIWNKTSTGLAGWMHGRANLTFGRSRDRRYSWNIQILASTGSSYHGDIAIDDLWIADHHCPDDGT